MNFDAPEARRTYSDRAVDSTWRTWCTLNLDPLERDVIDIGCGGGIYSLAFAELGAKSVIGVDRSRQFIEDAKLSVSVAAATSFCLGSATDTGLPGESADIVFERAVIHHLSRCEQEHNAIEAKRLLRKGGVVCVQDRTFENVIESHPDYWIRSTLFETFPHLFEVERARRPSEREYAGILINAGFESVRTCSFPEIRRRYSSFSALEAEVLSRKGKSILFELSDDELGQYCRALRERSASHPLIERDAWTVWIGRI